LLLTASCGSTPKHKHTEIDKGVRVEVSLKMPQLLAAWMPQFIVYIHAYEGLKEDEWDLGDE
jgi:hypothetical protein